MTRFKSMETKARLAKRCPFCGSSNITYTRREYYAERLGHGSAWVACRDCGTEMWNHDWQSDEVSYSDAIRAAVKKWNGRAFA